jgi:hypothetical protein
MLNQYNPVPLQDEIKLKYWQFVLGLTRVAAHAKRWGIIFNQHRTIMALAFLAGILLGLIPALK